MVLAFDTTVPTCALNFSLLSIKIPRTFSSVYNILNIRFCNTIFHFKNMINGICPELQNFAFFNIKWKRPIYGPIANRFNVFLETINVVIWFNIVLYYEALYWRPFRSLSYRHSSGVVRNPHSTLAEWGIFNLRSMSPQGTHFLIARRRNSITSVLISISWKTWLSATCEPRTSNLSITGERIRFTM